MRLRDGESIVYEAKLHWSFFLLTGLWAFFGILGSIGANLSDNNKEDVPLTFIAIFFLGPFLYKLLYAKTKKYLVTNKRVYLANGIIRRSTSDIPFNKINDLHMDQTITDRIFGCGSVSLYTGNSKPMKITKIDDPESFKEAVSLALESKESKAI